MRKQRTRRGITLLEVVVLIIIAFFAIALLLPAKRTAREAARRNQCMNHMKQLALALQNYHDVHGKFPAVSNQRSDCGVASVWWSEPGSGADDGAIPSAGYTTGAGTTEATAGYSWIVMILPFIDEANLSNAISEASGKFSADAFTPYNVAGTGEDGPTKRNFCMETTVGSATTRRHFAAVQVDEVICPSFSGTRQIATSQYSGVPAGNPPAAYGYPAVSDRLGSPAQFATITNYVALSATHFPLMQYGKMPKLAATTSVPTDAETPNGMIAPGTGLNMKFCKDGTAKTLMLCETIEPAMNCWYDGTTTWTTGINPNTVGSYPPSKADPTPWGTPNADGYWNVPPGGATALQVGPSPTTSIAYSPALAGYGETPRMISWGPSSNHSGGVVVHGAVDGSVNCITPDIDPTVYMHLITIAGHESDEIPDVAN